MILKGVKVQLIRAAMATASVAALSAAAQPAMAQSRVIAFDIPAQPLSAALGEFSRQSNVMVIVAPELTERKRAPALKATLPANEAIARLLRGSGLRAVSNPRGGYRIEQNAASRPASSQTGSSAGEAEVGGAAANSESADAGATPEILVVGQRTSNVDIRRTEDDAQPYVILDAQDIEQSQATNIEEFLTTRLPMNTARGTLAQTSGGNFGNNGRINLRGLGESQTLVLLNGRRISNLNTPGTSSQPDINAIPLSAVARVEVLPATAAGLYGGGATGGAVNIITRRDYEGLEAGATFGATFRGDALNYHADLAHGFDLNDADTQILLAASYDKVEPLRIGDRDFGGRARSLLHANNPAGVLGTSSPQYGFTTNIRSANGSNLVLDSGTALGSPITFVPAGYQGPGSDGGAALVANAGQYNLALSDDVRGNQRTFTTDREVGTLFASVRQRITSNLEAFADVTWSRSTSIASVPNALENTVTLAANAANNPFTTPIIVRFPVVDVDVEHRIDTESLRISGGAILRLPRDWSAALDGVWSLSRLEYGSAIRVIGDPDGTGPGLSGAAAIANGTVNIVRDLNAFPVDWTPYLLPSPNQIKGPSNTTFSNVSLRVAGPLVRLPGGPLTLTALAEYRKERADRTFQENTSASNVREVLFFAPRTQEVRSAYIEARVPLVSRLNALPIARELELQLSARHDSYETRAFSPSNAVVPSRSGPFPAIAEVVNEVEETAYTVGLRYVPTEGVLLRASYGTGFLPPDINQIVPVVTTPTGAMLIDPRRGNVPTFINFGRIIGGNTDLRPERSKSWSVGLVLEPAWLRGFRASVDYVHISKTDEINTLGPQDLLNLESLFPERVIRSPLTPADAALGFTGGEITTFDGTNLNVSSTDVEALDIQVDYAFSTSFGDWRLFAVTTWQPTFSRQLLPSEAFIDSVGYSNGPLEWRVNAGVNWQVGDFRIAWNAQWYDRYRVFASGSSAVTEGAATRDQGSIFIPSQLYHDLHIRYEPDDGALAGLQLSLGIQNVFDRRPPILASVDPSASYSTLGDPRLRRFTLGVRRRF